MTNNFLTVKINKLKTFLQENNIEFIFPNCFPIGPFTEKDDIDSITNKINKLNKFSTSNVTDNKCYNDPSLEMFDIGKLKNLLIGFSLNKQFDEFCGAINGVNNNHWQQSEFQLFCQHVFSFSFAMNKSLLTDEVYKPQTDTKEHYQSFWKKSDNNDTPSWKKEMSS